MGDSFFIVISLILLGVGLIGAILPVVPGIILSYAGLLVYKFGTGAELWNGYLWIFGILVVLSAVLEYLLPARLNRKYGGTRWGSVGSILGAILGFFFIPIPFGFLIGMFGGVFIAEMLHDSKDQRKAWNSTKGAFIGFLYGATFNFLVGLAMLVVVVLDLLRNAHLF